MKGIGKKVRTTFADGAVVSAAALLLLGSLGATPAFGQCTDTWIGGTAGSWSVGGNWSTGKEPGGGDSVCIEQTNAAVNMDVSDGIANLTLGSTTSLTLPGPGGSIPNLGVGNSSSGNGSYTIVNNGAILMGASQGQLYILSSNSAPNTVTLSGTGAITMTSSAHNGISGNQPFITSILVNASTIQGTGNIVNSIAVQNQSNGVINANASGEQLIMGRGGPSTNTGLIEATNGGQFIFGSGSLNTVGGTLKADGANSYVAFQGQGQGGQTVTGGTYVTTNGGTIYADNSTTIDGTNGNTINNTGLLVLNDEFNNPGASFQGTINNTGTTVKPSQNWPPLNGPPDSAVNSGHAGQTQL
jgi:hypothetical protein